MPTARASRKTQQWFEIPASYVQEQGVLLLRAPAGTAVLKLAQQLADGVYDRPFIVDDGEQRRLHFDLRYVQSAINLKDPDELVFAYTQAMMAFMLFDTQPRQVVVVGLGGGSLTRFCHQQLPRARVTTLEIDADVIALGEMFLMPPATARMPILHVDAAVYFADPSGDIADVVLIDGCDRLCIAPTFADPLFYQRLQRRVRTGGIVVVNLIGEASRSDAIETLVADTLGGATASLAVKGGNRVLFAWVGDTPAPDWAGLRTRAERLEQQTGLDFVSYLRRLKRSYRRYR